MTNEQKQDADQSGGTVQEGFSSDELGQQSSYDDATTMQRQIQRGDETKGDPNQRDHAGATDFKDTEEGRTDRDTGRSNPAGKQSEAS